MSRERAGSGLAFDQRRCANKWQQQPWRSLRMAGKHGRQRGRVRGGDQGWEVHARGGPLYAVVAGLIGSAAACWLHQVRQPCWPLLAHAYDISSLKNCLKRAAAGCLPHSTLRIGCLHSNAASCGSHT